MSRDEYFYVITSFAACLEPPDIPNAILLKPGGTLVGDVRIYKCAERFMQLGEMETVCEAVHGKVGWRKPSFKCLGKLALKTVIAIKVICFFRLLN